MFKRSLARSNNSDQELFKLLLANARGVIGARFIFGIC